MDGKILPFTPDAVCSKCHWRHVSVRHCQQLWCYLNFEKEHMHRVCKRCNYDWIEHVLPRDAPITSIEVEAPVNDKHNEGLEVDPKYRVGYKQGQTDGIRVGCLLWSLTLNAALAGWVAYLLFGG